jgi:predicted enzyme related to lactoylglutathione lyase
MANTPNMVVWFEIPTYDLERAKTFYEGVLDVRLDLQELGPLRMAWFPTEGGGQGSAGFRSIQSHCGSQNALNTLKRTRPSLLLRAPRFLARLS